MAHLWLMHGTIMAHSWLIHGSIHGSFMEQSWLIHGSFMAHAKSSYLPKKIMAQSWLREFPVYLFPGGKSPWPIREKIQKSCGAMRSHQGHETPEKSQGVGVSGAKV